jgi:predicted LPLAT superfamily acyltransferase
VKRWPFLDGWVLIALDVLAIGLWGFRDLGGMGTPVLVLCGLTLGWVSLRAWASRPEQPENVSWEGAWRGFPLGWQLYLTVLSWGGRRLVQLALVPLVAVYWVFLRGPQRDGIDAYLARRMPEKSPWARSVARLKLLLSFAHSLVDRFHLLLHGGDDFVWDRSRVEGLQERLYTGSDDSGVLVLSGHLGNADFASMALNKTRREVTIVLHKNPTDPYFALLDQVMGDSAPEVLPVNTEDRVASLSIVKRLREGRIVALKADRPVDTRVAAVSFLGGTIHLPTGPFLLAALSGQPTLIVGCFRTNDGEYRIEAVGPKVYRFTDRKNRDADLARWAQELADVMERWTAEYPEQWYNFFDPWSEPPPGDTPAPVASQTDAEAGGNRVE